MKKSNIFVSSIVLFLFALLVVYASYAYLAPSVNGNNLNIITNTSHGFIFSSMGGQNLASNIAFSQMSFSNSGSVVSTATDYIDVSLETDGLKAMCCSFDINWKWDTSSFQYTLTSGASKEYTIAIAGNGSYVNSNNTNVSFSYGSILSETQLPNYNSSSLITKITTGRICNNDSVLSSKVTQNLTLTTKFYNLQQDQNRLKNQTLKGTITTSNVICSKS